MYRHQLPSKDFLDSQCIYGLRLELAFPSCGNGSKDSSDHKSHMAYPNLVKEGTCPEGFDVHYPELFYETIYDTYAFKGVEGQFLFSYGDPVGTGFHGDFIMGWESEELLQNAIHTCNNASGQVKDCPLFHLQSEDGQLQCRFPMPAGLQHDNPTGPRNGLAVDVPIQYGPQQATDYSAPGQKGVLTTRFSPSAAPSAFLGNLSIKPYSLANPTLTMSFPDSTPALTYMAPQSETTSFEYPAPSSAAGGMVSNMPPASNASSMDSSATSSAGMGSVSNMPPPSAAPPNGPPASSGSGLMTSKPVTAGQDGSVTTIYKTFGNEVIQLFIEEVDVIVTATTMVTFTGRTSTISSAFAGSSGGQASGSGLNTMTIISGSDAKSSASNPVSMSSSQSGAPGNSSSISMSMSIPTSMPTPTSMPMPGAGPSREDLNTVLTIFTTVDASVDNARSTSTSTTTETTTAPAPSLEQRWHLHSHLHGPHT